ncbi:single-stranded DNA-binding protein [Kitasatospora sp. NPDC097643]|uniref:single-stranded DNA-binding protein n=1 Tax=Kitasatospora sp. NPDC097643 TaxID=3157230 RepID=UPI003326D5AF
MNETQVTVMGNVASEVSYGETGSGVPMANFRLGCTERRYDRQRECWIDGETQWLTVTAWRALAVNLIGSLAKGDPVLVSGRLRVREWGEGEQRRTRVEIDARSVGHDLTRGTSAFRWASGARGHPVGGVSGGSAGGALGGAPGGPAAAGGQAAGEVVPGWIADALEARKASAVAVGESGGVSGGGRGSDGQGVLI